METHIKKTVLFILFILSITTLYFFTPVKNYLSQDGIKELQAWISQQGILAPVFFISIYALATIFALPGSLLTLSGGLLFGSLWGTTFNMTGALIGSSVCFFIARYLGRESIKKILGKNQKFEGIDHKIGKNGFYSVLYLRLIPLFPFNGLNFGLGLTKVSFKDYFLGSLIGMLPACFAYTSLGAVGQHINLTSIETWLDIRVWAPFVLVILLTILPRFWVKK